MQRDLLANDHVLTNPDNFLKISISYLRKYPELFYYLSPKGGGDNKHLGQFHSGFGKGITVMSYWKNKMWNIVLGIIYFEPQLFHLN